MKRLIIMFVLLLSLVPLFSGTGVWTTPWDIQGTWNDGTPNFQLSFYGGTRSATYYTFVSRGELISEGVAYVKVLGYNRTINVCIVFEATTGIHMLPMDFIVYENHVYPNRITFSCGNKWRTIYRY